MIGNKKTPMGMDTPNTDAVNRIVEGTTFEGNIRSMSNMRVDGTFEGDIVTKGRLVVGPKGIIKATCLARTAMSKELWKAPSRLRS